MSKSGISIFRLGRIEAGIVPTASEINGIGRALKISPRVLFGIEYGGEFPVDLVLKELVLS